MHNHISIIGRMTRDPELRKTKNDISVSSFCLAVDRDVKNKETGEKQTDFIDCVAWRGSADFLSRYGEKGRLVCATGRLQTRSYEKDGVKHKVSEIVCESVYFLDYRENLHGDSAQARNETANAGFSEIDGNDDDLPF